MINKKNAITLLSILLLLTAWQIIAIAVNQPEFIPTIPRLFKTLLELFTSSSFYLSVSMTLLRGIAGIFLSLITATTLSFLFGRFGWLYDLFRPILTVMRSVPVISFILLALIFFHPGSIPLLIGFLTMFPLLTENMTRGIRELDPSLFILARQFQIGNSNRFTQIVYPQLKPFLYSGLTSAVGFGWRAIIMGEVLSQSTLGIGGEMKRAQTFIAVPELLAWTMTAIIISFISEKAINRLSRIKPTIRFNAHNNTATPAKEQIIQLDNVSYTYGVSNFTATFTPTSIYGISAPSGEGKTTLLNLINGTIHPTQGELKIDRQKGLASVFQEPTLLPHLNAIENITLSLAHLYPKKEATTIALSLLEEMNIKELSHRYPNELSYGQQQRVAIARALAFPSPFLLMDEPFKGLDEALTKHIIAFIRQRQEVQKQTILFTSHQPEELRLLADKIIYLK